MNYFWLLESTILLMYKQWIYDTNINNTQFKHLMTKVYNKRSNELLSYINIITYKLDQCG